MKLPAKLLMVGLLMAAVGATLALKRSQQAVSEQPLQNLQPLAPPPAGLPVLLEVGSDKCVPCKMMAPILDELKKEHAGKIEVRFIDIWKDKAAGARYGVTVIPTQIFIDGSGREVYRHHGFFPKEDIVAKWAEFGITLTGAPAQSEK